MEAGRTGRFQFWVAGRTLIIFLVFCLLLSGLVPYGAIDVRAQDESNNDVLIDHGYEHLVSRAQADGTVRVIVHLDIPFQMQGAMDVESAISQQQAVAAAQASIRSQMANFTATRVTEFKYIPFVAMTVNNRALSRLASLPMVIGIEEDLTVEPTLFSSVSLINADDAWAAGYDGSGQAVAIMDTGVQASHPFLSGKVISEACYSGGGSSARSLCPGGVTQSEAPGSGVNCTGHGACGHGTHVAGIAAGSGATTWGVARGADIIAIQVFSGGLVAYYSDIIKGLERVLELSGAPDNLDIASVNMSLGGYYSYSTHCDYAYPSMKAAIDNLRSVGIATVIASGNSSAINGISFPACISSAVSVGSTTKSDSVASYSNSAAILDVLAPGSSIFSSYPTSTYAYMSGTSMAAPHVAGAWAVLKSKKSNATVDEILNALKNTGTTIIDYRNGIGKPRIDVLAALEELMLNAPSNLSAAAVPSPPLQVDLAWQDNSDDETGFRVERTLAGQNDWQVVMGDLAADTTSYQDASVSCSTAYQYRVVAFDAGGDSGPSNVAAATSLVCAPGGLNALPLNQKRIRITWQDNSSDEDGFRVEWSPDGAGSWQPVEDSDLPPDTQSYEDVPLICNTVYYYRVSAFNSVGSNPVSGANTTTDACAPPPQPTGLSVEPLSINSLVLDWTDIQDEEDEYEIWRSPDGSSGWQQVGTTGQDVVEFTDTLLDRDTAYYYYLIAWNAYGDSTVSLTEPGTTYEFGYFSPVIFE